MNMKPLTAYCFSVAISYLGFFAATTYTLVNNGGSVGLYIFLGIVFVVMSVILGGMKPDEPATIDSMGRE